MQQRSDARLVPLILVDQLDTGMKEPVHLVAEPGLGLPAAVVDPQRPHELGQRTTQD